MRMLFVCRPTVGHFQPLAPLAAAAKRRGHGVAFATGEPMVAHARAAGFDCYPAGLSNPDSIAKLAQLGVEFRKLPPSEIRPMAFGRWFSGVEAPPRLADLDRICAAFRPDLLVHEVAELATPLAAARAAVPWVTVGFGPLLRPEVAALAGEGVAQLWHDRDLPMPRWAGLYRHLYVDPCPPSLQIADIDALPETIRLRPAASAAAAGAGVVQQGIQRRIYVTFGTLWNSGPAAVQCLRDAVAGSARIGPEVIVTVGSENDPAMLEPVAAHVQVHRFIPQDQVLSSCSCVVAHGGAGTLLGTLAWGVPLVLLPQFADQFYNAERAAHAGVALVLPPAEVSSDAVAACIRALLDDPGFATSAHRVRSESAQMPDVDTVMDRIEGLA